jgi:hypothetical protein
MLLARRKFVQSSLVFTAATALFWGKARSGFAQSLTTRDQLSTEVLNDPVLRFSRETFEPYVGGYFEAPGARGKAVTLKLLSVDSYVPPPRTKIAIQTNSFVLLFSADGELPTFTDIHPIKHGALGEFSLFLTRRDGKDEIFYEAVINHLH